MDRRGEVVAVIGGVLSLLAGVVLAILAIWTGSSAIWAICFQALGAVGIWLITLIQLHQLRLVAEERLELAAIERERQEKLGGATTIFEEEDLDQMEKLAMGRRMRTIERFLVPTLALIIAAYHIVAGAAIWPWKLQFPPIAEMADKVVLHPTVLLFFCAAIAFVCFMLSRYALGMSRITGWGLLRPSANYLFGTSACCLAAALALLCVITGLERVEVWVARGIGVALIFLGVETVVNYILDFYRPRVSGQEQRPFYDSRLLGMFSEPVGILRSVANTIDYQFGFKVSETWFYKLMGRAVLPLLLVQALVLLLLTCIVVVPPGHQAVIEHLGRLRPETAKAGVHLTWPWPFDRARIIPVDRIRRLEIGFEEGDEAHREMRRGAILWTVKHYKKEYQLLVADRLASETTKVPINLLSVNMPLQWRVRADDESVIRFYSQARDVSEIIDDLAFRELTHYAAQSDVLDLLGSGGVRAAETLHDRIQKSCDAAGFDGRGLGVEIVMVGIGGVHPPPDEDVAKSYEEVVGALELREATIKSAEGDAAKIRIDSAGEQWKSLHLAIAEEDRLRQIGSPELAAQTEKVERMLREVVGGQARARTMRALERSSTRLFEQKSAAERYETQLAAFRVAPEVYSLRLYLEMLEESLKNVRKYIIALEHPEMVVYDIDLRPPDTFDALSQEVAGMEQKRK